MSAPQPTDGTYYPNYAWIGAPAVYDGTGGSGGDSGEKVNFRIHIILSLHELFKKANKSIN